MRGSLSDTRAADRRLKLADVSDWLLRQKGGTRGPVDELANLHDAA